MDLVRVGIIGLGMGSRHATKILERTVPGLEVSALCDTDPSRLESFRQYQVFLTDSADALITFPDVDAVIVATPHYDHVPLSIAALEAGKHVLVEKPIAVHKAATERMLAAHTDECQVFTVMFNQRTNPPYRRLKALIDGGELGELRRVVWVITDWFWTAEYYRSGSWRATWAGEGGGVLLNQSLHQLDLWQWLFGMPDRVRAFCELGRYRDVEVEDDVTAYMEYDAGCKGVFITTTGESPGSNRLEVTGERGKVVIDAAEPGLRWWRNAAPMTEFANTPGQRGGLEMEVSFTPFDDSGGQHGEILENFARAILAGNPLIAPAEEGIHTVKLANTMLESSFREATVTLPLDGRAYQERLAGLARHSRFHTRSSESSPGPATDFEDSL